MLLRSRLSEFKFKSKLIPPIHQDTSRHPQEEQGQWSNTVGPYCAEELDHVFSITFVWDE